MAVDVASSLTSALGVSSGINTAQLVTDLTNASFSPRIDNLNALMSANTSRISALASAKNSLQTFSDALTKLLQSSQYSGTPVSNDNSIASVTPIPGGTPVGLPAQLEVKSLAAAQVLQSAGVADGKAVAGTGSLTLAVGAKSYTVTLASPKDTLTDLAEAINNTKSGVTASIVTDKSGSRLVLKGATGADNAFTLTADASADANLQRFTFDGTTGPMTKTVSATSAKIEIDGVAMEFDSNEVTTAIPNLRIDLNKAVPGSTVTIATDQPTATMGDLVQQIVDAYNSLKGALNTATRTTDGQGSSSGLLSNDTGVRTMANMLSKLAGTQLTSDGPYKSLNDIGVSTNRDGTLALNKDVLNKALTDNPEAVVQMLNPTTRDATRTGIDGALKTISTYLNASGGPLSASSAIYDNLGKTYTKQMTKLTDSKSTYSDRLTQTYASMQSRLLAFKATQSYLTQQITAWQNQK